MACFENDHSYLNFKVNSYTPIIVIDKNNKNDDKKFLNWGVPVAQWLTCWTLTL